MGERSWAGAISNDATASQLLEQPLQLPDPCANQLFCLGSMFRGGLGLSQCPSEYRLPANPHGAGQLALPQRTADQPAQALQLGGIRADSSCAIQQMPESLVAVIFAIGEHV